VLTSNDSPIVTVIFSMATKSQQKPQCGGPRGSYHFAQLHGASLRRWKFEIEKMRVLVHIWEAIKRNRTNVLRRVIVWKGDDRVEYRIGQPLGLPPAMGMLAGKDVHPMVLARSSHWMSSSPHSTCCNEKSMINSRL
jgi:hypothetical protein